MLEGLIEQRPSWLFYAESLTGSVGKNIETSGSNAMEKRAKIEEFYYMCV